MSIFLHLDLGQGWGGEGDISLLLMFYKFVIDDLQVQGELFLRRLSGFCVREAWAPGSHEGVVLGGQELIRATMS